MDRKYLIRSGLASTLISLERRVLNFLYFTVVRVFNKTVEYVNMFSKFSTEDTIGLVRS
jgi:hypothetical protein